MTANYEEHGFEVRAKKLPEACTSCPFWLVNPKTFEEGECYITGHIIAIDGPQDEGRMNDCPIELKENDGELMTNADKIRVMSNMELAEFLPIVSDFMCHPTNTCLENIFNRGECERTKDCALKWLQSEVKEKSGVINGKR